MKKSKNKHFNIPQILVNIVWARIMVLFWGRGTGKTSGALSLRVLRCAMEMPRSVGGFVGVTYERILNNYLPGMIATWADLGLRENEHFFVRKYSPEHYLWKKPYLAPSVSTNIIHWINGSVTILISQDGAGRSNGLNLDYVVAEEAKFLDGKKYEEEVLLTLRGSKPEAFLGKVEYLSQMLITDMPTDPRSNWIFDYFKQVDREKERKLFDLLIQQSLLKDELSKTSLQKEKRKLQAMIDLLEDDLNDIRRDLTYISEASTIDNVHALGMQYIEDLISKLSVTQLESSVFNRKNFKSETSFYGLLDQDIHGSFSPNNEFIINIERKNHGVFMQPDCRWDADCDRFAPLYIACDYNASFNCVVIGQRTGARSARTINTLYVHHPNRIKDLVEKFAKYYAYMVEKTVYYYYDQTAFQGRTADSDITFKERWVDGLKKAGFDVVECYIGASPTFEARHILWEETLSGNEKRIRWSFNRERCNQLYVSMQGADLKMTSGKIEKDKRSEKDKRVPPEDSTHLSEAGDTLLWGWNMYDNFSGGLDTVMR